jgi:MFS family permease
MTVDCTRDEMCATNNFISYQVDTSSPYSLTNWNQQLDMYCTEKLYIGLIGASAFAGSAVACLVLPVLGDKIGRLPVFLTTQLFQIPMYIAAVYTHSIGVVTFLVYYLGFCLIGRFTCGFVLFVELLPEKYKALSGTAILVGYSISLLESTFYYAFISKNSIALIWIGFVFNVLTFGANLLMPESPVWLISAGRYEDARDAIKKIAKYNGIENLDLLPFK